MATIARKYKYDSNLSGILFTGFHSGGPFKLFLFFQFFRAKLPIVNHKTNCFSSDSAQKFLCIMFFHAVGTWISELWKGVFHRTHWSRVSYPTWWIPVFLGRVATLSEFRISSPGGYNFFLEKTNSIVFSINQSFKKMVSINLISEKRISLPRHFLIKV